MTELADPDKTGLKPLFDDPPALQELSEHLQKVTPIRLASLSDRLGNIAFQIPVTTLTATFAHQRLSGDVVVSLGWHPGEEAWHKSGTDIKTVWFRLLSLFQPHAHAMSLVGQTQDWLPEKQTYYPPDVANGEYLKLRYPSR